MKRRLSFSTMDLVHSCERKYQLEKLLAGSKRQESEHLSFGTAYGAGVARYLETQDQDQALWAAFLAYTPLVESEKKSLLRCMQAMLASFASLDNLLQEWELVYFQDKPATELSFRIDIDEEYYYVGYIDAVLRNRFTGVHCVFECKTTGLLLQDISPLYKHSGQALGYSVVLDKICGQNLSSYSVLYFACQLGKGFSDVTVHVMPFKKTLLDRLNWFIVLGLDVEHLHRMQGLSIYPRRYDACLRFNRPCRHFGTCHLHSFDQEAAPEEEDLTEYQFCYHLEELIADHLQRIQAAPQEQEVKPDSFESLDSGWIDLDNMSLDDIAPAADDYSFDALAVAIEAVLEAPAVKPVGIKALLSKRN